MLIKSPLREKTITVNCRWLTHRDLKLLKILLVWHIQQWGRANLKILDIKLFMLEFRVNLIETSLSHLLWSYHYFVEAVVAVRVLLETFERMTIHIIVFLFNFIIFYLLTEFFFIISPIFSLFKWTSSLAEHRLVDFYWNFFFIINKYYLYFLLILNSQCCPGFISLLIIELFYFYNSLSLLK